MATFVNTLLGYDRIKSMKDGKEIIYITVENMFT